MTVILNRGSAGRDAGATQLNVGDTCGVESASDDGDRAASTEGD